MTSIRALSLCLRWYAAARLVTWAMHVARHDVALCLDLAHAIEAAVPRAEALRDYIERRR